MTKDRSGDRYGRTIPGRDRARGADEDHGAPHEVSGARADRRAVREQVVRVGPFGGVKVYRGGRSGELRDRFRG